MRNFKTFAVALAIMVCSSSFAVSSPNIDKGKNFDSYGFGELLKGHFHMERDYKGKVYFSLNKDRKILVHKVLCEDGAISASITAKMNNCTWLNPELR